MASQSPDQSPETIELPALDVETVARFADLFGDANPIHRPENGLLPTPLMPGSLLSILVERAVRAHCRPDMLARIQVTFLAPVPVGATQSLSIRHGPALVMLGRPARRVRVNGHCRGRLSYVAECVLVTPAGQAA